MQFEITVWLFFQKKTKAVALAQYGKFIKTLRFKNSTSNIGQLKSKT